jgi:ATP-dependent DNA helicase RecQ
LQIANNQGVPPFVVFSDSTLIELCTFYPQTPNELSEISGFGSYKIEKYGQLILKAIVEYCTKNNISSVMHKKARKRR